MTVVPGHPERGFVDAYAPIKGKCVWWREALDEEQRYNRNVRREDITVRCSCFVEGDFWTYRNADLPANCPRSRSCRYYIKHA